MRPGSGEPVDDDPSGLFDSAFAAQARGLRCRPQTGADTDFLIGLFVACSPLAGLLPDAMLRQQAAFQHHAHDGANPSAMQRIVELNGRPIGRFMIDWRAGESHGIDLAVMPGDRSTGAGLYLLRAWLEVADAIAVPAVLEVAIDNPAQRIYRRLGFVAVEPQNAAMVISMRRPLRQR